MAEVVGFVSAGIGVAAFALQVSSGIRALRQLQLKPEEAHREVMILIEKLTVLHQVVSSLKAWEQYQPVDEIISHVQRRYEDIGPILRDLSEKYQIPGEKHRRNWKRVRSFLSEHPKEQIRGVRENINDIIMILNLALMAAQCRALSIHHAASVPEESSRSSLVQEEDPGYGGRERITDLSEAFSNADVGKKPEPQPAYRNTPSLASSCSRVSGARKYDCSCHQARIARRFFFLQYTPLSSFLGKLGGRAPGCTCIGLRLRLALSKYGVPRAIVVGIGFMVDETGFELLPTLRTEKCSISLDEARERFIKLYQSDESFRNHKDPAGNTYIHTLLRVPWNWRQDDQFGLLHTLVTECGMTLAEETQSFLVRCANWIGEGRHLTLLEAILSYGYDATAIHASPFEEWPSPCSTDWYGGGSTPDPFFVEYIGTILKYSPTMGQTEVTKLLLSRGANPALRDSRLNWMFLDYAVFCEQWHLVLEALSIIQTKVDSHVFQTYVRCAIMSTLGYESALIEQINFLQKLTELCDDVNFTFGDRGIKDNNMMHYARTLEIASTLVRCGFNSFNQRNSEGKLAINSLSKYGNAPLIRFCLENGTNATNVSQDGRSILFELLPRLSSFDWLTWDVIDGIKLCLSAGADPFAADDCICPCSPDGCHIASKFGLEFSPYQFLNGIPMSAAIEAMGSKSLAIWIDVFKLKILMIF
ncbi:hypothetical protein FPRO06_04795 [Fusarium proliferatum]|nr:hypothetical protein FPRO06_04795 [Fusarium proliferatum]